MSAASTMAAYSARLAELNCFLRSAEVTAQIAAHRAHLAELRAQRPFRSLGALRVTAVPACRPRTSNPLLQVGP